MDTMLSKALREFMTGPLNQLIVNLGCCRDKDKWGEEFKKFLRKEPCWTNGNVTQVAQPKPTPHPILEPVSTFVVPATIGKFIAKEKFVRDTSSKAKVKINELNENFKEWFLSGDGKTEDPITEQTLRYHKLLKSSMDGHIIEEIGGKAKAETTLSEMFALIEKQGNGEDGVLLNNFYANIFYIKDQNGVLCVVGARWCNNGWSFFAGSTEDSSGRWDRSNQVFSRNPVLSSSPESSEPSAPAA